MFVDQVLKITSYGNGECMYELSLAECQRRRKLINELYDEIKANPVTNSRCECHASAQAALPNLLERLAAGDDLIVESILAFYQGCINAWAKDIYNDPVYESHFKAEIAARILQKPTDFKSESLCHQLKLATCEIADAHLEHIETHHHLLESTIT